MMTEKLVDMDLDGLNQTRWFQDNLWLKYEFRASYYSTMLSPTAFFVRLPPLPLLPRMSNGTLPMKSWVSSKKLLSGSSLH